MRQLGVHSILTMFIVALALSLAACGGGNPAPPPPAVGSATLDAAGGQVDGPDGVRLVVPPGALAAATTLRIARDGSGAPELGGAKAIAPVYAITPHGTAFAESARISIPFDPAQVAPGTQPVLLRAQPGSGWEALASDVQGGTVSAADTPGLSYYTVGTCWTSRDAGISGPDPLLYCPSAHTLQLTLLDGNGAQVPQPRNGSGVALPVVTVTSPTNLSYVLAWRRPAGTQRSDRVWMQISDAGLTPAQQPLTDFAVNADFSRTFTTTINPATVPGAGAAGGRVIRLRASVVYAVDAFYPGCACFRPASWSFTTDIPVRVIFSGVQPVITAQPQNQSVSEGQPATFSVTATGINLSYQWLAQPAGAQNLQPVPGETASTFTAPATLSQNGLLRQVQVCSNRGTPQQQCIESALAALNVAAATVAPVFTTQPASVTVIEGQTASFTAVASGQPAPTIGWSRLRSTAFGDALDPICTLATGTGNSTSATCTVGPLTLADNGMRIQADASNQPNSVGAAVSNIATISVVERPTAPSITTPAEPSDRTITAGGSASWTVGVAGTAPLSYQWRTVTSSGAVLGGVTCEGGYSGGTANGPTLTLSNVPAGCTGHRFFLVVSNAVNPPAESRRALLTVNAAPAAPAISVPLANRSVVEGTQVTFNVAATGSPASFTYTWTLGGAAVPNVVSGCTTTSATCTFTAQLGDSGRTVAVSVSNGVAPGATSSATLTVTSTDVPASITLQPVSQNVVAGATATFTVGVAGTPTPGVTWHTSPDGVTWTAAGSGTTLTLAITTLAQNGLRVRAVASNTTRTPTGTQLNTVTSSEVLLAVASNLPPNALLATQVMTAGNRTLALHPNRSVYAWGAYVDPVTGGYTTGGIWAYVPTRVQGLPAVRQVAVGSDYSSWALAEDGTVWGWGYFNNVHSFAQGPNAAQDYAAPVQLLMAANTPIDRVCQIEGTIWGVVMVRSEVAGGTCAASEPRSVWFTFSISGNEQAAATTGYALRYAALDSGGTLLPATRWIREIVTSRKDTVGQNSVFALANDGNVYAWGHLNGRGQLGLGHTNSPTTPQLATGWQGALRIAASADVTLALMPDGSIRGAGWNANAALGIGPVSFDTVSTPTTLAGIAGANDVSTTTGASMALVGGQLNYWGNDQQNFATATQVTPVTINAPATPLTALSVAGVVAVAIGPGNAVYAWGNSSYRGCQPNSTACNGNALVPVLVTVP